MDIEIGDDTFTKKPNILEEIAYRDTWGQGADSFISMIYERLVLLRDLLTEDGSIYVQMGPAISHYVRAAMLEIFGNTTNGQITWQRASSGLKEKRVGREKNFIWMNRMAEQFPTSGTIFHR